MAMHLACWRLQMRERLYVNVACTARNLSTWTHTQIRKRACGLGGEGTAGTHAVCAKLRKRHSFFWVDGCRAA